MRWRACVGIIFARGSHAGGAGAAREAACLAGARASARGAGFLARFSAREPSTAERHESERAGARICLLRPKQYFLSNLFFYIRKDTHAFYNSAFPFLALRSRARSRGELEPRTTSTPGARLGLRRSGSGPRSSLGCRVRVDDTVCPRSALGLAGQPSLNIVILCQSVLTTASSEVGCRSLIAGGLSSVLHSLCGTCTSSSLSHCLALLQASCG